VRVEGWPQPQHARPSFETFAAAEAAANPQGRGLLLRCAKFQLMRAQGNFVVTAMPETKLTLLR
jgi:hypothetical protein